MAYKKEWINKDDIPPVTLEMFTRFSAAFERPHAVITHLRQDAIFLQVNQMLNAYLVARFINSKPGFWIEFEATAPKCWTVRMFSGEWYRDKECPRMQRYAQGGVTDVPLAGSSFEIKATAHDEFLHALELQEEIEEKP